MADKSSGPSPLEIGDVLMLGEPSSPPHSPTRKALEARCSEATRVWQPPPPHPALPVAPRERCIRPAGAQGKIDIQLAGDILPVGLRGSANQSSTGGYVGTSFSTPTISGADSLASPRSVIPLLVG